jgi:hypothetical protein
VANSPAESAVTGAEAVYRGPLVVPIPAGIHFYALLRSNTGTPGQAFAFRDPDLLLRDLRENAWIDTKDPASGATLVVCRRQFCGYRITRMRREPGGGYSLFEVIVSGHRIWTTGMQVPRCFNPLTGVFPPNALCGFNLYDTFGGILVPGEPTRIIEGAAGRLTEFTLNGNLVERIHS